MTKRLLCTIVLLLGFTTFLFAQAQSAILEYFEDNSGEFKVVTADGVEHYGVDLSPGWKVPVGSTVVTDLGDYAELAIKPNGTVIRLSQSTNFKVEALQGSGQPKNVFSVATGKFRAVATKGRGQAYTFKGLSAVCGVRGTDLGMEVIPGQKELAFVLDGLVDYTNGAGQTVALGAGEMADALGGAFASVRIPPDVLRDLLQGMEFQRVTPPQAEAPEETPAEPEGEAASGQEGPSDGGLVGKVLQVLGVEIGAVTLDDGGTPRTFAKAIVQPRFNLGKLRMALYLPFIYRDDLFDPGELVPPPGQRRVVVRHRPVGLGPDRPRRRARRAAEDPLRGVGGAARPVLLQVRQHSGVDLGHGLIMRDYGNDTEFPSVRRVGREPRRRREEGRLGALVSDVTEPEIFAARLYTRPGGKGSPWRWGSPRRPILAALDDDGLRPARLPERRPGPGAAPHRQGLLSIVLYSDVAAMLPFFRDAVPWPASSRGSPWTRVWDATAPARTTTGHVRRRAGQRPVPRLPAGVPLQQRHLPHRLLRRLLRPPAGRVRGGTGRLPRQPGRPAYSIDRWASTGRRGSPSASCSHFKAGYEWPWWVKDTGQPLPDDYFLARLELLQGLPVPRINGSFSYERLGLVTTLIDEGSVRLFDLGTVFTGELQYPFSPIMNLALHVSTTAVEDGAGNLEPLTSVSIVTRVND